MIFLRNLTILTVCVTFLSGTIAPAYADPVDEHIKKMEETVAAAQNKYEETIKKGFEEKIRTDFLVKAADATELLKFLSGLQAQELTQANDFLAIWAHELEDLGTPQKISKAIKFGFFLELQLQDAKRKIENVGLDLAQLRELRETSCSVDSVERVFTHNDPEKIFTFHKIKGVKPDAPQSDFELRAGVNDRGQPVGDSRSSGSDVKVVATALGVCAGFIAQTGAYSAALAAKLTASATLAGTGVGLVAALVIFSVISAFENAAYVAKIVKQTALVNQLRSIQHSAQKSVSEGARATILTLCQDTFPLVFAEQVDQIRAKNDQNQIQIRASVANFNQKKEDLHTRYAEALTSLEREYFPNLSANFIVAMNSKFDDLIKVNSESKAYIAREIGPLTPHFQRNDNLNLKLQSQQEFWNKAIEGDAIYSPKDSFSYLGYSDPKDRALWETLLEGMIKKIFRTPG